MGVSTQALIDELVNRGYGISETSEGFHIVLSSHVPDVVIEFPINVTELPESVVRNVLSALNIDIDELINSLSPEDGNTDDQSLSIDVGAAGRTLENTPHPRHKLSDEALKRMREILARIDAVDIDDSMPTDISENLDEYIYTHTDEDSTK